MYLKIVSYHLGGRGVSDSKGNWSPAIVPHQDLLFECKQVDVCKHRFDGINGYHDIINPILEAYGDSAKVIGGQISDTVKMELLEIWLTLKNDNYMVIIGIDVTAFVMGETGRTIDKWVCGAGPSMAD